jgi:Carbohydrate family 9 binding domain-like
MRHRVLWLLSGLLVACGLSLTAGPGGRNTLLEAGMPDAGKLEPLEDAAAPDADSAMMAADPGPPSCSAGAPEASPFKAPHRLSGGVASTVDGNANDWAAASTWAQIARPFDSETSPSSVCAVFTAAWDEDAIHVLFRVKDAEHPAPATGDAGAQVWFNDAVELFWGPEGIDPNNGEYRGVDHQLVVDHRGKGWLRNGSTRRAFMSNESGTVQFVAGTFAWGYTVEVRVKNAAFGGGRSPFAAQNVLPFLTAFDNGQRPTEGKLTKQYYLWLWDPARPAFCPADTADTCCTAASSVVEPACNTVFFERIELVP